MARSKNVAQFEPRAHVRTLACKILESRQPSLWSNESVIVRFEHSDCRYTLLV